jgi:hypothetical protein
MSCRIPAILILLLFQMPAHGLESFTVTRKELTMMPPYCTALEGKHVGLPPPQDSPLRNTIPDGCPALHHYCSGLKAMIRVDTNRHESNYWLGLAVQTFRSVALRKDWVSCPVRPEAYLNLGRALLRQSQRGGKSSAEAVASFSKALELKPDYLAAYLALSDYYVSLGDKKKALSVVGNGLRHVPDSKWLLRRFKELGGTTPPAPIVTTSKPVVGATEKDTSGEEKKTPSESAITQPAQGEASPVQQAPAEQSSKPKIGSPTNPWCRFCPPE